MVYDDDHIEPPYIPVDADDRPPVDTRSLRPETRQLIMRLAREDPDWSPEVIVSLLLEQGVVVPLTQVATVLQTLRSQPDDPFPGSAFSAER